MLTAALLYTALLLICVAVHEGGHALALAWHRTPAQGVHLGVGPLLWRAGTLHVHLIPLAGYVEPPATHASARTRARMTVIIAGCLANAAFGLGALTLHQTLTRPAAAVTVQEHNGELRAGDVLMDERGVIPNTPEGQARAAALLASGAVQARRGDQTVRVTPGDVTVLNAPGGAPVVNASRYGADTARRTWTATAITAASAVQGQDERIRAEGLSSPVSAMRAVQTQLHSPTGLLLLLGVMNLSMAAFNALPLLPLDGGRLAVLGIERLTRRTLTPAAQAVMTLAGLAFVALVIGAAFWADLRAVH